MHPSSLSQGKKNASNTKCKCDYVQLFYYQVMEMPNVAEDKKRKETETMIFILTRVTLDQRILHEKPRNRNVNFVQNVAAQCKIPDWREAI